MVCCNKAPENCCVVSFEIFKTFQIICRSATLLQLILVSKQPSTSFAACHVKTSPDVSMHSFLLQSAFTSAELSIARDLALYSRLPEQECAEFVRQAKGDVNAAAELLIAAHPNLDVDAETEPINASAGAASSLAAAETAPPAPEPPKRKRGRPAKKSTETGSSPAVGHSALLAVAQSSLGAGPATPGLPAVQAGSAATAFASSPDQSEALVPLNKAILAGESDAVDGVWQPESIGVVSSAVLQHIHGHTLRSKTAPAVGIGSSGIGKLDVPQSELVILSLANFLRTWVGQAMGGRAVSMDSSVAAAQAAETCFAVLGLEKLDPRLVLDDALVLSIRSLHRLLMKHVLPAWDPTLGTFSAAAGQGESPPTPASPALKSSTTAGSSQSRKHTTPQSAKKTPKSSSEASHRMVQRLSQAVASALVRLPHVLEKLSIGDSEAAQAIQACTTAVCTEVARGQRWAADACRSVQMASVDVLCTLYKLNAGHRLTIVEDLLSALPRTLHGAGKGTAKRSWSLGLPMLPPGELFAKMQPATAATGSASLSSLPAVADYSGTLTSIQPCTALLITLLQRGDTVHSADEVEAAVMEACASSSSVAALKSKWGPKPLSQVPALSSATPSLELDDDDDDEDLPLAELQKQVGRGSAAGLASLTFAPDSQEHDADAGGSSPSPQADVNAVAFVRTVLPRARSVLDPIRSFLRTLLGRVLEAASLTKAQKSKQGWTETSWATILKQLVTDVCIVLGHPNFPAAATVTQLLQKALSSTLPRAGQDADKSLASIQPLTTQLLGVLLTRLQTIRSLVDATPLRVGPSTAEVDLLEADATARAPPLAAHTNTSVAVSGATKAAALLPFTLHSHAGALQSWLQKTSSDAPAWRISSAQIRAVDQTSTAEDATWMVQAGVQMGVALQLLADAHRDPSAVAALRTWYSWWLSTALETGNMVATDFWRAAVDNLESNVVSMASDSRASRTNNAQRLRMGMQAICFTTCLGSWERHLKQVLNIMSAGSVQARKKALDALKMLVQVQPSLLSRPAVRSSMRLRLQDKSISVRAATVELLGQHILQDPSLAKEYADVLLTKLHDSGLSVRKSAVNTLHKLLVAGHCAGIEVPHASGPVQLDTAVLHAMLERASDTDEEEAMRDLVSSTVDKLWFSAPDKVSDGSVATDLTYRSLQLVQLMQLSVGTRSQGMDTLEPPGWLCSALREALVRFKSSGKKGSKKSRSEHDSAEIELALLPALYSTTDGAERAPARGLAAQTWKLPAILPALVTGVVEHLLTAMHNDSALTGQAADGSAGKLVAAAAVLQAFAAVLPKAIVPHVQVLVQFVTLEPCVYTEGTPSTTVVNMQKLLATRTCSVLSSVLPLLSAADTSFTASLQGALSSVLAVQREPLVVPSAPLMHAATAAWGALISQVMAATPRAFLLSPAERPDAVLRVQLWMWLTQCRKMRAVLDERVPDIDGIPAWLTSLQSQSPWTYMRVAVALYGMGLLVRAYNFDYEPPESQEGSASEESVVLSQASGTNATPTTLAQAAAVQSACSDMPVGTVAALVVDEYSVWSDVPHAHLAVQAMRGLGFVLCRFPALLAAAHISNIMQESMLPSVHPDVRAAALQSMADVLSAREAAAIAGQGVNRHIAQLQAISDAGQADTSTSMDKAHAVAALGTGGVGPADDHSVVPAFVLKCLPMVRSALCAGEQPYIPSTDSHDESHEVNKAEAARLRFAAVSVLCGVGERGVLHTEQVLPSLLAACGDGASKVRQLAEKSVNIMCSNKPHLVRAAFADGVFAAFLVSRAAAGHGAAASPLLAAGKVTEEGGSRMRVVCDTLYSYFMADTPSVRQAMFRRVLRRFDASVGAQSSLLATARSGTAADFSASGAASGSEDDEEDLEQWATEIAASGQDALALGLSSMAYAPSADDSQDMAPTAAAAVRRGVSLDLDALQYVAYQLTALPFSKTQEPAALANLAGALVARRGDAVLDDVRAWEKRTQDEASGRTLVSASDVHSICELVVLVVLLRMIVNLRVMYELKASAVSALSSSAVTKSSETAATVPAHTIPPLSPLALPPFLSRYTPPRLADSAGLGVFVSQLLSSYASLVATAAAETPGLPNSGAGSNADGAMALGDALRGASGGASPLSARRGRGRKRAAEVTPKSTSSALQPDSTGSNKARRVSASASKATKSAKPRSSTPASSKRRGARRSSRGQGSDGESSDEDFVPK